MRNWLIKKLSGYTKEEYEKGIQHNYIQELEYRVRNGKDVIIGVRNLAMFENIIHMFNKDVVTVNRSCATIKYDDITFKVVNVTNRNQLYKMKGLNLNGFFFID